MTSMYFGLVLNDRTLYIYIFIITLTLLTPQPEQFLVLDITDSAEDNEFAAKVDLLEACGIVTAEKARGWFMHSGYM